MRVKHGVNSDRCIIRLIVTGARHYYVTWVRACPERALLPLQSVFMPIHGGLFANAKCPHDHIWGPFCHCKVSPCPNMGAFLPMQSVPMPKYGGLFANAKCPHARIWGPFCQCKVSPCPCMPQRAVRPLCPPPPSTHTCKTRQTRTYKSAECSIHTHTHTHTPAHAHTQTQRPTMDTNGNTLSNGHTEHRSVQQHIVRPMSNPQRAINNDCVMMSQG